MHRRPWTELATFYECEGRPAFVIATLGLGKCLDPENRWPEVDPATLAKCRAISLSEFAELRAKYAPTLGSELVQNWNLNVWLEELGLIGPPP